MIECFDGTVLIAGGIADTVVTCIDIPEIFQERWRKH